MSETTYSYDILGRHAQVNHTFNGRDQLTEYQYNAKGQLARLTYPSGLKIKYKYNSSGQVKAVTAKLDGESFSIVKDMTYRGIDQQLESYTWGNDLVTQYSYNSDNRISSIVTDELQDVVYQYDDIGNITRITRKHRDEYSQTFEYDALSRLTDEHQGNYSTEYAYDGAHNRTQMTVLENDEQVKQKKYGYATNANRLESINQLALVYDANGNLIEDKNGKRQFEYDVTNRLTAFYRNDKLQATYGYNHLNQRVKKTLARNPTKDDDRHTMYFSYLPEGWLQSETGQSANGKKSFNRDYVWLEGKPIAQIETTFNPNGKLVKSRVFYMHADHLNTPRVATNDKQKVVWRWDSDAFGNLINTNENKLAKVRLRFPGQYSDEESGLFYNHHRDYDPSIGRYIQSDPIGLGGGINNYVYTVQNPMRFTDPTGQVVPAVIACAANPACVSTVANVGFRIWQGYKVTSALLDAYLNAKAEDDAEKEKKNACIEYCSDTTLPTCDNGFSFQNCLNDCMGI